MSCFYKMPCEDEQEIRIVLVGTAGKGRSSTKRTILREKTPDCESSAEEKCLRGTEVVDEKKVVVVDTPGLFASGVFALTNEEVVKEIKRSIKLSDPGPHVFLFVMEAERFTSQYKDTLDIICRTFGENTMDYTMVLFTRKDDLTQEIEEFIKTNGNLGKLISLCKGGYYAFNNKDDNQDQVLKLLEKISVMIKKNKGRHYTHKMLQEAEKALKEQQKPKGEELKVIHRAGLVGTAVGCVVGYFVGGGNLTSSMGAAAGAVSCGILALVAAGLVIKTKKLHSKCRAS